MADVAAPTNSKPPALSGRGVLTAEVLRDNPVLRHLAVMVGIAASVALGVAVVLWAQSPSYSPLYGSLAEKDALQVIEALKQVGADYKVDPNNGMVLVESSRLQELRMQLAGQGLPNGDGLGFEMLQKESGFGTSQLIENARYHHAMEGELARTIATLASVQSARVHLALPKQSVFVRKRKKPTASVVLKLYPGRALSRGQIDAIVHLVASSVPEMEPDKVTVVDQKGELLSTQRANNDLKLSASQFEYTRKVEEHFRSRIEDILAPIVGADRVRAQVTADIDFTATEQTQEQFNPDQPALRSEQLSEQSSRLSDVQGVPGALSNQPPAAATAPQQAQGGQAGAAGAGSLNSSKQATRNFELDRVVSHTRMSPATLRRLSVAVVVDDNILPGPEQGVMIRRERTPEEIERITQLVREAIGYSVQRGDSVKVLNSPFLAPEAIEPLPEPPIWERPWFWDLVKQIGGVIVALLVIFGVLRPTLKRLTQVGDAESTGGSTDGVKHLGTPAASGGVSAYQVANGEPGLMLDKNGEPVKLPGPAGYENVLQALRDYVDEDPKRVAQLVKTWIAEDAA